MHVKRNMVTIGGSSKSLKFTLNTHLYSKFYRWYVMAIKDCGNYTGITSIMQMQETINILNNFQKVS